LSGVHAILSFPVKAAPEERLALQQALEKNSHLRIDDGPFENQFIVSGEDEATLEAIAAEIPRTNTSEIGELRINFLETIGKSSEGEGKYIRQTGGHGNYGHCRLRTEPGERGSGYVFRSDVTAGLVPGMYVEPIERGIREAMKSGILAGFPMVDLQVTLFDGSYHETDSNPAAFQIAAAMAFKEAAKKAAPFVLEPVMAAEVTKPEESIGAVIGDINARRGRVVSMERKNGLPSVHAILPLAEVLRSSTHGRPDYPLRFAGYEAAPTRDGGDAAAYAGKPRNPWVGRDSSAAKPETEF
jgi:elongation factor G